MRKRLNKGKIDSWPSYIQAPVDKDGKMWTIEDCVVIDEKEGCITHITHIFDAWYATAKRKDGIERILPLDQCRRPKEDSLNAVFNDMPKDYQLVGLSYIQRIQCLLAKSE